VSRPGAPPLAAKFPALIGADLLRRLVPMQDAIESSRRAFTAASRGEITGPLRSSLSRERVLIMPAEHSSGSALIKVISMQSNAWARGVPSIGGGVLWIDALTGQIAAMLDAASLTALRTGAASGLATAMLAPRSSRVLAMLGAGDQAADQVAGVCAVRPIREVRVYSRRPQRSQELCERLTARHPGVAFSSAQSAPQAVRGADVICTATRSTAPLFQAGDLMEQAHINAVGAYRLDMCELPPAAFRRADVVVIDQLEAALAEAGDLTQAMDGGYLRQDDLVEIGQLLARRAAQPGAGPDGGGPGRGLTIFKSVGIAAQDWSVCELAVRRAREAGVLPAEDESAGQGGP
jgi:ornithine cyclodeaminase/alanine dehydrogenase-like protein (mu-crystallin family)